MIAGADHEFIASVINDTSAAAPHSMDCKIRLIQAGSNQTKSEQAKAGRESQ
jgi:hypothetical protein